MIRFHKVDDTFHKDDTGYVPLKSKNFNLKIVTFCLSTDSVGKFVYLYSVQI